MSKDENKNETAWRQEIIRRLLTADGLYTLISLCTREPYVLCDEETFDDEALIFFDENAAKEEAKRLAGEKIPTGAGKLEKKQMLMFYTGLFTMGVNAILIKDGAGETRIQLEDIVKRKKQEQMPDGSVWVENPGLHLTALYYMQELRRPAESRNDDRLKQLQEEITADFRKGRYIIAVQKEEKGTPLVKVGENVLFQPVFTDILEFQKFNKENKFSPMVLEFEKIPKAMAKEATGVVINVMGVNLPLTVKREG